MKHGISGWVLYGSLFLGLLVLVVPLPDAIAAARPYLLAMLLAYWVLEAPERVGLGTAFLAGLLADLVAGTLLGAAAAGWIIRAINPLHAHKHFGGRNTVQLNAHQFTGGNIFFYHMQGHMPPAKARF